MKYVYYKGLKFTKDDKTGYYLNSTHRLRLHRYVYQCEVGEIPNGYEIHHIDLDKDNNVVSNLQLLSRSEHRKLHASLLTDEQREWKRNNLNTKARPKACEWHGSEAGRKWHSEHAKNQIRPLKQFMCEICGSTFYTHGTTGRYCSDACRAKAFRRRHNESKKSS